MTAFTKYTNETTKYSMYFVNGTMICFVWAPGYLYIYYVPYKIEDVL